MYVWVALLIFTLYAFAATYRKRRAYSHPPGPPADPIFGHFRKLPSENIEETYHEWAKIYGDVMRIWLPGINVIVLNSDKACVDLLHKRSSKYSSRQIFHVLNMMGWGDTTSELPYGKRLIAHRRVLNEYLHRNQTGSYIPIQLTEARKLLRRLLNNPEGYEDVFTLFSTAVIMKITYGRDVNSFDDPMFEIARAAVDTAHHSGALGTTALDFLPILKHFPSWFPGTYYVNYARERAGTVRRFFNLPYEDVHAQVRKGIAEPSFLSRHIQQMEDQGLDDEEHAFELKCMAAQLFIGGADTTTATLKMMLLAFVLNPEAVARAQKEIDDVVGTSRLPDFGDRENLPYLECVVQEIMRWHPISPAAIPHLSTEDDVYEGMYIPKGSIIFPNCRGITLDERVYRNPDAFYPERYLPKPEGYGEPHPACVFGYGRRACPGRYLGLNNVWIVAASIIAAFDMSKAIGADGKVIEPKQVFTVGIVQVPEQFEYRLKARSQRAQELIGAA